MNCSSHRLGAHPGQTSRLAFMGLIHLQTECIISENFLSPFSPPLPLPRKTYSFGGNGFINVFKNHSDLLGNLDYHKRVAERMQTKRRALKTLLLQQFGVEKGPMMDGTWFSAERFCSFYSCQWLMYFIFCFLYCHLSSRPQARGMSLGTHSSHPPWEDFSQLFCN